MLLGYARSIVGDHGTAEDLVHQVFVRLLRTKVTVPDAPRAYLVSAVRNAALNHRRDRSREVSLEDGRFGRGRDGESGLGARHERWFERDSGREGEAVALEHALQQLPDQQREVLVLHLWGEMTFAEVAAVVGISANTAASRYRYAIAKLREQLAPAPEVSEAR